MDGHPGYEKSGRSDNDDCRNGYKRKRVNSRYGSMEIEAPQNRLLDKVYPILFIGTIHYPVRDNSVIRKLAAYVIFGIHAKGRTAQKEFVGLSVDEVRKLKTGPWLYFLPEM